MNISLERIDNVNATLVVNIEKADCHEEVEKVLKSYRKNADMPGFRKGMVPMGLIRRRFGMQVLAEEVNKRMQQEVDNYIKENKLEVIGSPIPNEERMKPIDLESQDNYEFVFDLPLAPEFEIELNKDDKIAHYNIQVSDKMIDDQVESYRKQASVAENVQEYTDGDMIKGMIAELDDEDNVKEGGITRENVVLSPKYMKNDEQQAIFNDAKLNDVIIFNPYTAFDGNEAELSSMLTIDREEVESHKANFSFQITEIKRMIPANIDQAFFDKIYGEDNVKSEEEMRERIKEMYTEQFSRDADYKFFMDAKDYASNKAGELELPTETLKKMMKSQNEQAEKPMDEEEFEKEFPKSLEYLKWELIRTKLMKKFEVKVEQKDIFEKAAEYAKAQFAQYGMTLPEELEGKYVEQLLAKQENAEMFFNRSMDDKLTAAIKENVTLDQKDITLDDFNKMFEN